MSSFRRGLFGCAVAILGLAGLTGCGSTYRFKVDAIKNPEVAEAKQSYQIVSGSPEMDAEDLRFKEAERYVKTALSAKGMYEAPPGTQPEMLVEVDFGMEEPRTETRTFQEPVYVTVELPPDVQQVAVRNPKTGEVKIVSVLVRRSEQRYVGTREQIATVTVYEKYIRITAREAQSSEGDRPPREIWSVYVKNEDQNDDLRQYVPLMVSAAMDSLNEGGSAAKEVVLNDNDERVAFVKKGM